MKITEIVAESVVQIWSRSKGGQMVRKYRCTSGPRKGRIVANPATCTQPKKFSSMLAIKKAKARRGSSMNIKRSFTKRTHGSSMRLGRLNKSRAGRHSSRRGLSTARKKIRS